MPSPPSKPTHRIVIQGSNISAADISTPRGKGKPKGTAPTPTPAKSGTTPTAMPEFSRRSRNAFIKALNSLCKGVTPELVVELNYTENVSRNPKDWKKHLDNLRRDISRTFPKSWWFWRIEPHPSSGRPHYHLFGSIMDGTTESEFWHWIDKTWCRIIKAKQKDAPYVTLVQKFDGDMDRMTRYLTKPESDHDYKTFTGSWARLTNRWGKIATKNIPYDDKGIYEVSENTQEEIKELIVASVQTQLQQMEDDFAKMTSLTNRKKAFVLEEAIKAKKTYLWKLRRSNFYWSVLDREHVELARTVLEDKDKAGTL